MEEDEGGIGEVTGSFEPPDGTIRPDYPHHEGFDKALQNALDAAAAQWGPGQYPVTVRLEARVDVRNPGTIGDYLATLSPTD